MKTENLLTVQGCKMKGNGSIGNGAPKVPVNVAGDLNPQRNFATQNPESWLIIGCSRIEAHYETDQMEFRIGSIRFKASMGWEVLEYIGKSLDHVVGGKRSTMVNISALARKICAKLRIRDEILQASKELTRLLKEKRLAIQVHAINANPLPPSLEKELRSYGGDQSSLELFPEATSLVLSDKNRSSVQWIFEPHPIGINECIGQWDRFAEDTGGNASVLLLMNVRSEELARYAILTGLRNGARIYSLATDSISLDARLNLFLPNCLVTQFNLEEFVKFTRPLGIECPDAEHLVNVPAVCKAIAMVVQVLPFPMGDLIVTMGLVGIVAYDSWKRSIAYISLTREALVKVRNCLPRDGTAGLSERTFAAMTLVYERTPVAPEWSRVIRAVRQAWAQALCGASPFLKTKGAWFQVTLFASKNPGFPHVCTNVSQSRKLFVFDSEIVDA